MNWNRARRECLKLGGSLATFDVTTLAAASHIFKKFFVNKMLLTGFQGTRKWFWTSNMQSLEPTNLWGPYQPDGDGVCGSLLNRIKWNQNWKEFYWNDLPCVYKAAYICQDNNSECLFDTYASTHSIQFEKTDIY